MSEKRSKYDTDPLDPDFARHTDEMWGATRGVEQQRPTNEVAGNEQETLRLPERPAPNDQARAHQQSPDAPTRRMDEHFSQSYPSIFIPPTYHQPPAPYQQPPGAYQQPYVPPAAGAAPTFVAPERTVAGINITEKYATVLPYAPFYIGLVAALIELLLVPRRETRVRFHAAQGLALQLAILAISYMLTFIGLFSNSRAGGGLVSIASLIFLIISMARVWKGQEHRIPPLSDATKWLNERISPRKS